VVAHVTAGEAWAAAKRAYPVGAAARGTVKDRFPYGVFLHLDEASGVHGFIDLVSYNPDGTLNDPAAPPVPLPQVGDRVEGVVADLVDRDRQIRIRVGPPFWES
jgi:ribosomal protein S1